MEIYSKVKRQRVTCRYYNKLGNNPDQLYTTTSYSGDRTLVGYYNPIWEYQVANHYPASTPMSGTDCHIDVGSVMLKVREDRLVNGLWQFNRMLFGYGPQLSYPPVPSTPPPLPAADLNNDALGKFYDACRAVYANASGMTALVELPKTLRQLRRPFRSLMSILRGREIKLTTMARKYRDIGRDLRARRVVGRKILLRDLSRAVADSWLEVQYGLKPLVRDIEDTATYLLRRRYDVEKVFFPVKAISGSVNRTVTYGFHPGGGNQWWFEHVTHSYYENLVRYKGELRVEMPIKEDFSMVDFSRLGFNLYQFVPTLVEVTPWSFLVDYFSNLSTVINSFCVPTSDVTWFNCTKRSTITSTRELTGKRFSNYTQSGFRYYVEIDGIQSRPGTLITKRVDRSGGPGPSLPRPSISLDLPTGKQFANIVALAASRWSGNLTNRR